MMSIGMDAIGIDPNPKSPNVSTGSHEDLWRYQTRLLLIVWPPDGTSLQKWVDVWQGDWLAICGSWSRFDPPSIETHFVEWLPALRKSRSKFVLGRNPNYQREE